MSLRMSPHMRVKSSHDYRDSKIAAENRALRTSRDDGYSVPLLRLPDQAPEDNTLRASFADKLKAAMDKAHAAPKIEMGEITQAAKELERHMIRWGTVFPDRKLGGNDKLFAYADEIATWEVCDAGLRLAAYGMVLDPVSKKNKLTVAGLRRGILAWMQDLGADVWGKKKR